MLPQISGLSTTEWIRYENPDETGWLSFIGVRVCDR
jgi:hypothetical protein